MSGMKSLAWGLFWFVATMALMIGAAYLWFFIYSLAITSSGDQAFYEQYAQMASPFVAVATALPVFFLMGRSLCRQVANAAAVAAGVVIADLLMEVAVLSTLDENFSYVLPFSIISGILKIGGAYWGTRPDKTQAADGAA